MSHLFPEIPIESDQNQEWEESLDDLTCEIQLDNRRLTNDELRVVLQLQSNANRSTLVDASWRVLTANGYSSDLVRKAVSDVLHSKECPSPAAVQYLRINAPNELSSVRSQFKNIINPDLEFEFLQCESQPESKEFRRKLIDIVASVSMNNADSIWNYLYQYGDDGDISYLNQRAARDWQTRCFKGICSKAKCRISLALSRIRYTVEI
jgi:hypothetical protein